MLLRFQSANTVVIRIYSVTFRERRAYPCCPVDVALAEIALEAINDLSA